MGSPVIVQGYPDYEYREGDTAAYFDTAVTITDPDNDLRFIQVLLYGESSGDRIGLGGNVTLADNGHLYIDGRDVGFADLDSSSFTYSTNRSASTQDFETILRSLYYYNIDGDALTDHNVTLSVYVDDMELNSDNAFYYVDVLAEDDPAVAQDDRFYGDESSVVSGNVFDDNGYGPDSDPDGPALQVTAVNGEAAYVGTQITLDDGSLLTVNADGTFTYDPNGAYATIPGPDSGSPYYFGLPSFTYTLANGSTATVAIGLTGVDSEGDRVVGTGGDDVLDGGIGADAMYGLAGDDTFLLDNAGDVVYENPDEGSDTIRSTVSFSLPDNVEDLILTGGGNIDGFGNGLDNQLFGTIGNNLLDGGGGADIMRGGAGDDSYYVDNADDRVSERDGAGSDTIRSSVSYRMPLNVETLILTGPYAINGSGNFQANVLIGNDADNVLNGAAGADTLQGEGGNDTFVVDNPGDLIVETADHGRDAVLASISYTLTDNVEDLRLTGTNMIDGTGNDLANFILGNAAANVLTGWDGDDALNGGGGDDRLLGGDGNDTLNGGNASDWIDGGAGLDVMAGGSGADYFVFAMETHSGATPRTADRILDFSRAQGDRILVSMDADTSTAENDPFTFIGTGAFTQNAGELRYEQIGANTYVFGDTDGDGTADFAIRVDGTHAFQAGDFII
ncbi:hypothetical protein H8M03_01405 [Sphingomonas sabuli]|uniref:RapA2 cadherin-like domain-containing protein n=1 Tax=Sphingomonas sabuli TaxID=2764186 RepID=A0A7G9L349_9SPHN|nr:Ig-like domain-containing protein [Sphingomonas sabuli]QNM83048.1 hypothetical protein H8M03_01405 [Sphingomonas sabuli]